MNIQKLFQRLRKSRTGVSASSGHGDPTPATPPIPLMDRFDIQRAIIQYLEWCVNFNNHLGAESCEAPPTEALPDAAASGLGQWLSRNRRGALAHHPLFVELEQEHQRFHALAEQALTLTRNRKMGQASTLLNTDFERSRARVLGILRSLQRG